MAGSGPDNQDSASGSPVAEFGANEWLVDEMFERYQEDPQSVDGAWLDVLQGRSDASTDQESATKSATGSTKAPAKKSAKAPAKKSDAGSASNGASPAAKKSGSAEEAPAKRSASSSAASSSTKTSSAKTAEKAKGSAQDKQSAAKKSAPVPKETLPAASAEGSDEPTLTVLRGAPMRTAQTWTSA